MNIAKRDPSGATVTPIGIPPRHDLWRRLVLAKAVLGHRPLDAVTAALLLRILDGEQINDVNHPQQGQ